MLTVRCAVVLALLSFSSVLSAAPTADGGGRDVTIALFSTHSLHSITVSPLAPDAWTATCGTCAHQNLTAALQIKGPTEVFAGGTLRLTDDESHEQRSATGLWHLRSIGPHYEIDAVLTLPSERYVAAVLGAEAAPNEPPQSLRALAILARTYALNGIHYAARSGHLPARLCDSTQCQAVLLGPVSPAVEDATRATTGETLWFNHHRAEVFFSQSCGGTTEDAAAVWPTQRVLPYLRSQADPYCVRRDTAAWHAEIPLGTFVTVAQAEGWNIPADISSVHITQRSVSHRALHVVFTNNNGTDSTISGSALRFGIGRALGWNRVRSDAYDLGLRNGSLVFDGHGHGHGVGLCQAGATEMASEGDTARAILAFYFPGTTVGITPEDQGWQEFRVGDLTLRATQSLTADRVASMQHTWGEAQKLFPPRHALAPEIIFAPTTEIFRQLTKQPGWALASTGGSTIVLQPDTVLQTHELHSGATLLHELLHVLVESESSNRAPLWLREGLVEVLAGEPTTDADLLSPHAINTVLLHPDSLRASQQAHRAAAAYVQALLTRYGSSTIRGWLSTGVPPGVS